MERKVKTKGEAGNAYFIMARVEQALKEKGRASEVAEYLKQAKSKDYAHLVKVSQETIDRIQ